MEIDDSMLEAGAQYEQGNLKLLCVYGVDMEGKPSSPSLDVIQQQMNGFADIEVISALTAEQLQNTILSFEPQIVMLMGAQNGDLVSGTLGPLNQPKLDFEPEADAEAEGEEEGMQSLVDQFTGESLAACFQGGNVETVIIAAPVHDHHERLRQTGVSHVIHWEPCNKVYALSAFMFLHSFFGLLRNASSSVQEAYEVAIFFCAGSLWPSSSRRTQNPSHAQIELGQSPMGAKPFKCRRQNT
eukprot:TRINITY_DN21594_c0_g1_i2.p1 TRINITY_DN21594_c0_g1~~TRINITY_DN21594_c0_g1_i2.p1  ORF type:complete len:242 (-),score=37.46 TRINITY_DN21594_c0_g1_i2:3-728(-)